MRKIISPKINCRPLKVDALNDVTVILCSSGTTGLPKGN